MAVNKINIIISAQNRASSTMRKARKDVKDFRSEVVRFNRNLFTATAIIATFAAGFRRAMNMADVGARLEFVNNQFNRIFGDEYLRTLSTATRHTMDSMSLMQTAVQNHARGLTKLQTKKIFTLSVGAAKVLGTTTADAAKRMSKAFADMSSSGLQNFLVLLNQNDAFKNQNILIQKLTKGLNAAGRMSEHFRNTALRELEKAFKQFTGTGFSSLELMMRMKASFKSFSNEIGRFLSTAMKPLTKNVGDFLVKGFLKLNAIFNSTDSAVKRTRYSIIMIMQTIGGAMGVLSGFLGGWGLLRIVAATVNIKLRTLVAILGTLAGAISFNKDKNKSWLDTLGDIAAEMQFYFQAFTSYKDGISTFSGELAQRIGGMSKQAQQRILGIASAIIQVKEVMSGFVIGLKTVAVVVGAIAKSIGETILGITNFIGLTDPKQHSKRMAGFRKSIGIVAGAGLTSAFGLNIFKKGLGGVSSLFGKRGNSPAKPLYVQDVAGTGRLLGGFGAGATGSKLVSVLKMVGSVVSKLLLILGTFITVYKATQAIMDKYLPGGTEAVSNTGADVLMETLGPKPGLFVADLLDNLKGNISESKKTEREAFGAMRGNPSTTQFKEIGDKMAKIQEEGNRNTAKLVEQNSVNPYQLKDTKPSQTFKKGQFN